MLFEENMQGTAFIVGRFQPITKLHYQIIDDARKKYQQTFIVVVNPPAPSHERRYTKSGEMRKTEKERRNNNPFNLGLRMKLIHSAFGGKFHPSHIITAPNGFTPDIIEKIVRYTSKKKNKEKIVLLAGSDRIPEYKAQLEKSPSTQNIEIHEISRDMSSADNVSATRVRDAIRNDNFEEFKNLTPSGIHDQFETLKKHIMSESSQKSFFRRMLNEMIHIEDLSVEDFIEFVRNIYKTEASVKLDGTVALLAGFEEDGRFYTGLGRDFRSVNPDKRKYSVEDWLSTKHIKVNAPVSAHAAIESKMSVLKQILKPGETVTFEVLFGDKPNSIVYNFKGINYLVVLNNDKLGKVLKGSTSITVPNYVIESDSISKIDTNQKWIFGETEIVDTKSYDIDINQELKKLEDFLESETEGKRNFDILSMRAAGGVKNLVQSVREQAQKMKLDVKEKLLMQFVRKIQGGTYPPAEGSSHEGIVLKLYDKMTKIIDKEVFTRIHEKDWEPLNASNKILKAAENKQQALAMINKFIDEFDKNYPNLDATTRKRMLNNLRMSRLEIKEKEDEV